MSISPVQSPQLYSALKNLGGVVRYVELPAEGHNYRARESALHILWEISMWLDKYVKNVPPAQTLLQPSGS